MIDEKATTAEQIANIKYRLSYEDHVLVAGHDFVFLDSPEYPHEHGTWEKGVLALHPEGNQVFKSTDPWRTRYTGEDILALIVCIEQEQNLQESLAKENKRLQDRVDEQEQATIERLEDELGHWRRGLIIDGGTQATIERLEREADEREYSLETERKLRAQLKAAREALVEIRNGLRILQGVCPQIIPYAELADAALAEIGDDDGTNG